MEVGSPAFSYIRYFSSACVHGRGRDEMFLLRAALVFWGVGGGSGVGVGNRRH